MNNWRLLTQYHRTVIHYFLCWFVSRPSGRNKYYPCRSGGPFNGSIQYYDGSRRTLLISQRRGARSSVKKNLPLLFVLLFTIGLPLVQWIFIQHSKTRMKRRRHWEISRLLSHTHWYIDGIDTPKRARRGVQWPLRDMSVFMWNAPFFLCRRERKKKPLFSTKKILSRAATAATPGNKQARGVCTQLRCCEGMVRAQRPLFPKCCSNKVF